MKLKRLTLPKTKEMYIHNDIKKVVCPYCNGDKTVDLGWENIGHSRGSLRITETCPVCKGEGITIRQTIYKPISECDPKPINDTSNKKELEDQSKNTLLKIEKELQDINARLKAVIQQIRK
ncbi:hypothetical protein ACT29H_09305 [Thermophagus sp. OGC60D27]|uniref:hypothetical protein n=1 Tax=Thermophagus sp. OGC60D27 TaxID=3458415 RepID=UPI00403841F8